MYKCHNQELWMCSSVGSDCLTPSTRARGWQEQGRDVSRSAWMLTSTCIVCLVACTSVACTSDEPFRILDETLRLLQLHQQNTHTHTHTHTHTIQPLEEEDYEKYMNSWSRHAIIMHVWCMAHGHAWTVPWQLIFVFNTRTSYKFPTYHVFSIDFSLRKGCWFGWNQAFMQCFTFTLFI